MTLLLLAGTVFCIIKVDPTTQLFVDEFGRVRIFHGVNAVYKVPPWHPQTEGFDPQRSLSEIDIKNLQNWGFNAVRLGTMWPGVEPTKGKYNTTYLAVLKQLVDNLAAKGIYTILDFHQDDLNRKFCGEGIPDWAVVVGSDPLPFPIPALGLTKYSVDANGYPPLSECLQVVFSYYYFAQQTSTAFQALYDNVNDTRTSFANFWATVSSVFKDHQHVLGYELINEPWVGNIWADPLLIEPGVADAKNLAPLYSILNDAIRKVDKEHIVFFEKAGANFGFTGLTTGPGGPAFNDRQAYSYHVYCGSNSTGTVRNVVVCDIDLGINYAICMHDLASLGCGGFMTEFGAVNNVTSSVESINGLTYYADLYFQSWAYWQFKYFDDLTTSGSGEGFYDAKGQLEINKVKALSRTYAQATAGLPRHQFFDPKTSEFRFIYAVNTTISQPTEIYLNEAWYYPNGYNIVLSPPNVVQWKSPATNKVILTPLPGAVDMTAVTVTITRK
jgi:endoglycosylceramidase